MAYIGTNVFLGGTLVGQSFLGDTQIEYTPFEPATLAIDYLVVAGGGGGGGAGGTGTNGGGAGAGGFASGSFIYTQGIPSLAVIVGAAGLAGSTDDADRYGGNSSLGNITTTGGGRGGSFNFPNGGNGGSGGGGADMATTGTAGTGITLQGREGANATATNGGGGGGATSAGSGQNGGGGKFWLDGVEYAFGGKAPGGIDFGNGPGSGGDGAAYLGTPTNGEAGIVIVRYSGTPVATGGTITQSGGYTYHTFTSNGAFRY
jgi:hypothetical protein